MSSDVPNARWANNPGGGLTGGQVTGAVLAAGLAPIDESAGEKLAAYGNLILRWNARTNLTAISDPATLLQRHLVESIAAAQALPAGARTLLDYGSGAGLPGIPIAICRPECSVTLAESQAKKASFLQEATRCLVLNTRVFGGRVADMPPRERFDVVTLRAVDRMEVAILDASRRLSDQGWLALFLSDTQQPSLTGTALRQVRLPTVGSLVLQQGPFVPRGTAM